MPEAAYNDKERDASPRLASTFIIGQLVGGATLFSYSRSYHQGVCIGGADFDHGWLELFGMHKGGTCKNSLTRQHEPSSKRLSIKQDAPIMRARHSIAAVCPSCAAWRWSVLQGPLTSLPPPLQLRRNMPMVPETPTTGPLVAQQPREELL